MKRAQVIRSVWTRSLFLLAAVMFGGVAHATLVFWTLQNDVFNDGGTAVGSFLYDADTNTYSSWSISVSGGNTVNFPPFTYTPGNSIFAGAHTPDTFGLQDPSQFINGNPAQDRILVFFFNSGPILTNAGGTVPFSGIECFQCGPSRNQSGSVLGGPVPTPEPGTATLLGAGILLMAVGRLRLLRRSCGVPSPGCAPTFGPAYLEVAQQPR